MVLQTIGGLITLFAAIFAAWYAKEAAREARRGATAAETGVSHAREVSQTELRASIKSEHETFKPTGQKEREFILALKLKNVGQTPAHGFVISQNVEYTSRRATTKLPSPASFIGTLVHDAEIDHPVIIQLAKRQLSALQNKRAVIFADFRVTFLDDFEVPWVYLQSLTIDALSLASGQAFTVSCRQIREEDERKEREQAKAALEAEEAQGPQDTPVSDDLELHLEGADPANVPE